ncbi:TM2 domain-containing protein 1-like [Rhopilema esculentum]|uniref:TM2 domain-containing protein 1-like n=1 Tax=Rhopilema esculentum TaxID=499914 RepID=UPI0031E2075E
MKQFLFTIFLTNLVVGVTAKQCQDLLTGQYRCSEPEIDVDLQTEKGCQKNHTVQVPCFPAPGVICDEKSFTGDEIGFYKHMPCRYVSGKSFEVALLLSIFLGFFGIDRFYLGYPAIGLLKLCTLGFFMIFQLIDVILIATQVLKPADGSDYIISYYGLRLTHISSNNQTLYHPQNFGT